MTTNGSIFPESGLPNNDNDNGVSERSVANHESELEDDDDDSVTDFLSKLPKNKETHDENEVCKQQQPSLNCSDDIATDNTVQQVPVTKARKSMDDIASENTAQLPPANTKARKSRIKIDDEKTDEQKLRELLSREGVLNPRGGNYDETSDDFSFSANCQILWDAIFRWEPLNLGDDGQAIDQTNTSYTVINLIINLLCRQCTL